MPSVSATEIVLRWCDAALDGLAAAREELDAINVYPVADGDTGTNLFLTMKSAVSVAGEHRDGGMAGVVNGLARGALVGARGNSGSILAQMLRGLAEVLGRTGVGLADGRVLAEGLVRAADEAFQAVAHPVEGTMLTVARAAGEAASRQATAPAPTLTVVALAAARAAHTALAETPEQLDVLREAGVVDAGGCGLTVLLDALGAVLTGERTPPSPSGTHPARVRPAAASVEASWYEVTYLIDAPVERVGELKAALAGLGDSLVVAGGDDEWNVHVHVHDPGAAVEAGIRAGRLRRITVTHLDGQGPEPVHAARIVVAVAAGDGMADLYASAGATVLAGHRPSAAQILAAVGDGPTGEVVILPNARGTAPAAESAAADLRSAGRRAAVIPTVAQVQALAALAVHEPGRSFDTDVSAMTTAAGNTRHGAVTVATRAVATTAGDCRTGDVLGVIGGEAVVIGSDLLAVGTEVAARMLAPGGELVTIVTGSNAPAGLAAGIAAAVREAHPDADTVVYHGGQPRYPLLFGVE